MPASRAGQSAFADSGSRRASGGAAARAAVWQTMYCWMSSSPGSLRHPPAATASTTSPAKSTALHSPIKVLLNFGPQSRTKHISASTRRQVYASFVTG